MTCLLIKRENWDTETDRHRGRMSCEQEGRDMADVSTSQGISKIAIKSPRALPWWFRVKN